MSDVKAVAAGSYHTIILKNDGTLWATGSNSYGQFGNGTSTNQNTPAQIMSNVEAAAAGYAHTMVLKTDGTLWAAGGNGRGQLGDGTVVERYSFVQIW